MTSCEGRFGDALARLFRAQYASQTSIVAAVAAAAADGTVSREALLDECIALQAIVGDAFAAHGTLVETSPFVSNFFLGLKKMLCELNLFLFFIFDSFVLFVMMMMIIYYCYYYHHLKKHSIYQM